MVAKIEEENEKFIDRYDHVLKGYIEKDNTETIEQIKEDIKMVESNFKSFTEKNK